MTPIIHRIKNYLQHPLQPEQTRLGTALSWIACSITIVVFLRSSEVAWLLRAGVLATVVAVAALSIGKFRRRPSSKAELIAAPSTLLNLAAMILIIQVTGDGPRPLFLIFFISTIIWSLMYRLLVALGLTLIGCVLMVMPMFINFDKEYFQLTSMIVPVLFGMSFVLNAALTPLRARAKENRHLATLARSTEILTKQNVEAVLSETVRQVIETTKAESCIIFLIKDERELVPHTLHLSPDHYDPSEETLWRQTTIQIGQGMTGWVAQERKALISGDTERDPRSFHVPGTIDEDASSIIAPMVVGETLYGVAWATRQGLNQFADEDLHLLQVLTGQAAISIEQARLYEETRELALTDHLTGLYNRHYFNRVLEPSLKQSSFNENLAVLMIDVYDFKTVNDGLGHLAGDARLKAVASLLRESVRPNDIVVRYGGDEFVVVMPQTELEQANLVKENIEAVVHQWNQTDRPIDHPGLLLNIGVDVAPAADLEALLTRADQAMYVAKRSEERRRLTLLMEESETAREKHALQSVLALTKIQELKDPYSRGHAERARRLAIKVAEKFRLSPEEIRQIGFGAVLHDVGKIVIPPEILQKAGPLDEAEKRIMRRHPEFGANIVGELEVLVGVKALVLHHHERFDGDRTGKHPGYPEGLAGEQIPIGARIIAVVDSYDAMTSDRSYRRAMSQEDAIDELNRHVGTQFDPDVVDALLEVLGQLE